METAATVTNRRMMTDRRDVPRAIPERRRGRPKSADPGGTVCAWLPASDHDRVIQMAREQRQSVSQFVAGLLRQACTASARL